MLISPSLFRAIFFERWCSVIKRFLNLQVINFFFGLRFFWGLNAQLPARRGFICNTYPALPTRAPLLDSCEFDLCGTVTVFAIVFFFTSFEFSSFWGFEGGLLGLEGWGENEFYCDFDDSEGAGTAIGTYGDCVRWRANDLWEEEFGKCAIGERVCGSGFLACGGRERDER